MIKQWLQIRRVKKYVEQFDKGYAWALFAIKECNSPVWHVEVAVRRCGDNQAYIDGAIACCKHHS